MNKSQKLDFLGYIADKIDCGDCPNAIDCGEPISKSYCVESLFDIFFPIELNDID
jgi:hypothetical protein